MSDRDLLKRAAKAVGFTHYTYENHIAEDKWGSGFRWNPLTNDGDAFRLAVKLRLQPRQGINLVSVTRPDGGWNDENYRDHNNNPFAATRRAIVRAAAEIGRAMP